MINEINENTIILTMWFFYLFLMVNLTAKLFIESDMPNKEVLQNILQYASEKVGKDNFAYEIYDIMSEEGKKKAEEHKVTEVPTIIFSNIARISGTLSEDFINAAAMSLLSSVSRNRSGSISMKKEEKYKLEVAMSFLMHQVITKNNSNLYVFLAVPTPDYLDIEQIQKLAESRKIFILTNFEKGSEEQRQKLGALGLHDNVILGHIIRDNMIAGGNLTTRKGRPFSSAFFRTKISNDMIKGKWTSLLSDSIKLIKEFYIMLFMASSPVSHDGAILPGSNRQVAKAKDNMDEVSKVLW